MLIMFEKEILFSFKKILDSKQIHCFPSIVQNILPPAHKPAHYYLIFIFPLLGTFFFIFPILEKFTHFLYTIMDLHYFVYNELEPIYQKLKPTVKIKLEILGFIPLALTFSPITFYHVIGIPLCVTSSSSRSFLIFPITSSNHRGPPFSGVFFLLHIQTTDTVLFSHPFTIVFFFIRI